MRIYACIYMYVCVCVCVCVYIYICIYDIYDKALSISSDAKWQESVFICICVGIYV